MHTEKVVDLQWPQTSGLSTWVYVCLSHLTKLVQLAIVKTLFRFSAFSHIITLVNGSRVQSGKSSSSSSQVEQLHHQVQRADYNWNVLWFMIDVHCRIHSIKAFFFWVLYYAAFFYPFEQSHLWKL